jgi:hypothetical protein
MKETAMQIRADGTAEIYRRGRQYLRVRGDDGEPRWLKRSSRGLRPVSDHRARQLDRIFRHAETAKAFCRRPRLEWERKPGQPVYCPAVGFGQIVAVQGDKVTAKFGKNERVMGSQDLVTRAQVEADWHLYWLSGERRRLEEGKRLSIIKSLCRYGEWHAFLDKYDYPRSSADDLIRRYHDELRWEGRTELTGNRAGQVGEHERDIHECRPNPGDDELKDLIKKETEKRHGKEPSYHKTLWSIRIKLPQDILTLCRERYKRKSKSAKEFWRLAAYIFIGLQPPHKKHRKSHRHDDQPK